MSGFVGIVNGSGAPVDSRLLRRLTEFMSYRGPDAREIWVDEAVGFGRARLRTKQESATDRLACSLDSRLWIVGDVRLDARSDLLDRLHCRGLEPESDLKLLLRAYDRWGDACVDHLLGDFAFVIWNRPCQRLFGARDHFGVKLFYYARCRDSLLFSNTLDCLRAHPEIPGTLNESAIGDFLLFGSKQDPSTTTFEAIRQLPPAHTLSWMAGSDRVRRYWALQPGTEVRYRSPTEYVERFSGLLRDAVRDRLETDKVAVYMSGGLDSPAIAATARDVLSDQGSAFDLRAHTIVWDGLIPDDERRYSTLVAQRLNVPIHHHAAGDYQIFQRWDQPEGRRPEPWDDPFTALYTDVNRAIARHSRVALTGFDGDALLSASWRIHAVALLKSRNFRQVAADILWYLATGRRLPPLGIRSALRRRQNSCAVDDEYPAWLNDSFERRQNLRDRWSAVTKPPLPLSHCRGGAYKILVSPVWTYIFENYDAGVTGVPLEVRHPLIDLRIVRFALSLPPVPACVDKWLIRESTRGVLPESVRLRPKSPLAQDPVEARIRRGTDTVAIAPVEGIGEYVNTHAVRALYIGQNAAVTWARLRPHALNRYLHNLREGPAFSVL